jgi:uncharacterized protein (DUF427 family)
MLLGMWNFTGQCRPDFAITPGPGQESVWDYPRPPALENCSREVVISSGGRTIARSQRAIRVLETASPPTVYLPPADVDMSHLVPAPGRSHCEWKGAASYFALTPGGPAVAWHYPAPRPAFEPISGYLCFYPGRVDCFLGGERVSPQAGGFYGGWVTPDIVGPFKGDPGTGHW